MKFNLDYVRQWLMTIGLTVVAIALVAGVVFYTVLKLKVLLHLLTI